MRQQLYQLVQDAVHALAAARGIAVEALPAFTMERPKQEDHGDFATNAALVLARAFAGEGKPNPRKLAEDLRAQMAESVLLASAPEIAGPGYLNFRVSPARWQAVVGEVLRQGADFGTSPKQAEPRINLEFVSANPTGPMHVGHGRGAAYGDAIARLMVAAGYSVTREFYINDRGNQARLLGISVHIRYKELLGEAVILPEDVKGKAQWYQGTYVVDIAKEFLKQEGERFAGRDWKEEIAEFRIFGVNSMMARIRDDLGAFGVSFDIYSSEKALYDRGDVNVLLADLQARGLAEEREGALWFQAQADEDEDRVLRKQNGDLTYFATDIAYHKDKMQRGFAKLIDIWGADHHGYIPRMRDSMRAIGADPNVLEVLLVQFVTLASGRMGKRSGNFVTLRELVDEVGCDATRFFFLMRSAQSQLEFDLDLAKKEGLDNPVYHAQYGHARCCAIVRRAQDVFGRGLPSFSAETVAQLTLPEELSLLRRLESFAELVRGAAEAREPHRLIGYITELSQAFQSYYTFVGKTRRDPILPQKATREQENWEASWNWAKTDARLLLVEAIRQVLANALALAGVSAPTSMTREEETGEEDGR